MTDRTAGVVIAREGFVGEVDGQTVNVYKGDLVEADHPIVKKWPDLFSPPRFKFPMPVTEQATARPGEKRKR